MAVASDIRSFLLTDESLTTLVGDRIYPVVLPQQPILPAITYQWITGGESDFTYEGVAYSSLVVQISAWAETYLDMEIVADAIRRRVSGFRGDIGGSPPTIAQGIFFQSERDGYENIEGSSLYRRSMDFYISLGGTSMATNAQLTQRVIELENQVAQLQAEIAGFHNSFSSTEGIFKYLTSIMAQTAGFPDPNYPDDPWRPAYTWEGGEAKFGKWRLYFNTHEKSWMITYNCPFNVDTNQFGPRDSGRTEANTCMMFGVNVAEGGIGANSFTINFAPAGEAGTLPDFNAGSRYNFYDGYYGAGGGVPNPARPASLHIRGAVTMGAEVCFMSNDTTGNPSFWSVGSWPDGSFKIRDILDQNANKQNNTTYGDTVFEVTGDKRVIVNGVQISP